MKIIKHKVYLINIVQIALIEDIIDYIVQTTS